MTDMELENIQRAGRFYAMAAEQCERASRIVQGLEQTPIDALRIARSTAAEATKMISGVMPDRQTATASE